MNNINLKSKFYIFEHFNVHSIYFYTYFFKFICLASALILININFMSLVQAAESSMTSTGGSASITESLGGTSGNEGSGTDGLIGETKGTLDTIFDTLTSLTCESQGIGNLLREEFTHTCVPTPMLTFLVANIVSPGAYANTFLRLAINDKELFPDACKRANRIEYDDQKISFGLCSNTLLAVARTEAIAGAGLVIAQSLLTGENVWDLILETWNLPKESYYEMFLDKKENDEGVMIDVGILPILPWKVIKEKDKLCVATQSLLSWIPVGCKYIKDPYPISIYADFLDIGSAEQNDLPTLTSLTSCAGVSSCYKRAYDNSKTAVVISGPIIECVKDMIAKMMVSKEVCSFDEINQVLGSSARKESVFFQFQKNMYRAVSALLSIYIIIFGAKVLLAGDVPPKNELINFVIKFIFVVYFSVGININVGSGDDTERLDGMIEWALPFLLQGMSQLSGWIMNADPSQLCNFSDIVYPAGLEHLHLWDALDCRVTHYLGIDAIMNVIGQINSSKNGIPDLDALTFPIPSYFLLVILGLISGTPIIAIMAILYPIFIVSMAALLINATVICMISIVVLAILAPIFVPLYLFEFTKSYFESWVKLLLSFMLQPMVITAFMLTMMIVNDYSFYGTCKYTYRDTTLSDSQITEGLNVSGLNIPLDFLTDDRTIRFFYLDMDWTHYDSDEEIENCQNTLSYFLRNPMDFLTKPPADNTQDTVSQIISTDTTPSSEPNVNSSDTSSPKQTDSKLADLTKFSPGMFFDTLEIVFENIRHIVISMLTCTLIAYLMTQFSETLTDFAADMTEGVSLGSITVKPATIQAALKKVASEVFGKTVKGLGGGLTGGLTKGVKGAGSKVGGGAKRAAGAVGGKVSGAVGKVGSAAKGAGGKATGGLKEAKYQIGKKLKSTGKRSTDSFE